MRGSRGSQYATYGYEAAVTFPMRGEDYRVCYLSPPEVIRITDARSSNCTATPLQKATTLPELAGTRSPGTTTPVRFSGSAAETVMISRDGSSLRIARKDSTAT